MKNILQFRFVFQHLFCIYIKKSHIISMYIKLYKETRHHKHFNINITNTYSRLQTCTSCNDLFKQWRSSVTQRNIFFRLKSYEGRRPHIAKVFSVYFRAKVVVMKPFSCRFKKNKQLIYFLFKDRMMLFIFYFTLVKLRGEHQVTMQHCDSFVLKLLISGQIHQVTNPHSMYQEMNTSHRCVIKYTILHKRNRSYIRHYSRLGPHVIYCMIYLIHPY